MDALNAKRPCHVSSSQTHSSLPISPQSHVDLTISSFLSLSDLSLFSSPLSIGCSFDRVLDKMITSGSGTEFDQDHFLNHTLQLASILYKSTKRCIRNRATLQNSISWPLLPELTTKVFSMLDTKSLMQASACCKMFNKCSKDRVCYSHIDLTTGSAKHVDNGLVCVMIHRAGKELRSLKLGSNSHPPDGTTAPVLTRSCLTPLSSDNGFAGGLLRSLHLYNLLLMDRKSLCAVLSACSNLTDLKIVGFFSGGRINPLELLASITRNCRLIEHLFIDIHSSVDSTLVEFVDHCPNLTSLSLLHCGVNDSIAQTIINACRQLKYLNLSRTSGITGCFLRGLGLSCRDRDSPLEILILRNCTFLEEGEVLLFLNSLIAGDFKSIRYIDVSSNHGLVSDGVIRNFEPEFPIEELRKQRPSVTFVAIFESLSSSSSSSSSSGELHLEEENFSGSSNDSNGEDEEEEFLWGQLLDF